MSVASRGASIVAHCRSQRDIAEWLARDMGDGATVVCADLTDSSACAAHWDEALAWRASIDVLVNNAGAWTVSPVADAAGWAARDWTANLSLNLVAPAELALTKGIARGFAAAGVLAYAVAPGWVAAELEAEAEVYVAAARLPLGDVTPAQDGAQVIALLASGRSPTRPAPPSTPTIFADRQFSLHHLGATT